MREAQVASQWHPDEDELVEVCLGHSDPRTQEEVTVHLARCAACRTSYAGLADAVEAVLPAVPRIAPPPGFEDGVLRALDGQPRGATGAAEGSHTTRPVVRREGGVGRRAVLWAAAAGLLGAVAGAGATAYLGREREPATDPWAVPLLTGGGAEVGTVAPGYDDRGPVLVVAVLDGEPGLAVTCLIELTDGHVEDMGRWELSDERTNSWVVPLGDYDVARIDLLTDGGTVWASAAL